jgi:hypothetical protein
MPDRDIDDLDREDEDGLDPAAIERRLTRVNRILTRAINRLSAIRDGAQPTPNDGLPPIITQLDQLVVQSRSIGDLSAEIRAKVTRTP